MWTLSIPDPNPGEYCLLVDGVAYRACHWQLFTRDAGVFLSVLASEPAHCVVDESVPPLKGRTVQVVCAVSGGEWTSAVPPAVVINDTPLHRDGTGPRALFLRWLTPEEADEPHVVCSGGAAGH